jgi:galactose mutarotase-like enzyme
MQQIHTEYDGQWVFLIECKKGEHGSIVGGVVAIHSENRDVVLRNMEKYDYESSLTLFRYAGKIPEGIGVLL